MCIQFEETLIWSNYCLRWDYYIRITFCQMYMLDMNINEIGNSKVDIYVSNEIIISW